MLTRARASPITLYVLTARQTFDARKTAGGEGAAGGVHPSGAAHARSAKADIRCDVAKGLLALLQVALEPAQRHPRLARLRNSGGKKRNDNSER